MAEMTDAQQRQAAKKFAADWKGHGYEKGESQKFWLSLLGDVLGAEYPGDLITFEDQVHLDHASYIDGYIETTHVMIEQKSIKYSLNQKIKQSDESFLTPFQQAKRYASELPYSKRPRWIVTSNFAEIWVYDMEQPNGEPEKILVANLEKEYYRLGFLLEAGNTHLQKEMELSIAAGDIVGLLYDALRAQYKDPDCTHAMKSLNVLCVRIVFCLYAEDAGLFGSHGIFHSYLSEFDAKHMRRALIDLFRVLDTPEGNRDPYLADENPKLASFPYVNGGLFADESIEIPSFTEELRELLLEKASDDFDWSDISPTIFGAVFESTLNPETRRSGGMHYTSIENIHKVIDPLFLDDLKAELKEIMDLQVVTTKKKKLEAFRKKLAGLTFLDPAAGSGNFLTETYLCLRRMENEIISELHYGQLFLGEAVDNPILVNIGQFYGIEINDFAVTVARTALWIAECQMMHETEGIINMHLDFLPLKTQAHIVEANALRINWEEVVPKEKLNYIMGNPPFVGARLMTKEQKTDVNTIFKGWKSLGNLDYVSCWYKKTADFMIGTSIRGALVSTNSITQGEQVAILWKPLFKSGVHIDFAHRTFRWDSEASIKAHVHCVIIGFSIAQNLKDKVIYTGDRFIFAKNINGYLIDAPDIFVENRSTPLCADAPIARSGNKPIDNGYYLFSKEEMDTFIKLEPASQIYFRPWIGSKEYINNIPRFCLWLGGISPHELQKMPECLKRVKAVREFRLKSKSAGTRKLADNPTHFHVETILENPFLVMPLTSSERRRYVPIGFLTPNYLASNLVLVVTNVTLYDFGILTSNVFMAWMRAVCGRLKSDYRITKDNVYNNFPWPSPTAAQKQTIEQTAQAILDARALYPDCSLADLYDEVRMPPELRKAHQKNDITVMAAYGWKKGDAAFSSESDCVAELMKLYQKMVQETEN